MKYLSIAALIYMYILYYIFDIYTVQKTQNITVFEELEKHTSLVACHWYLGHIVRLICCTMFVFAMIFHKFLNSVGSKKKKTIGWVRKHNLSLNGGICTFQAANSEE